MQRVQLLNNRYQIQQQLSKRLGRQTFLALDVETQASVVVKLLFFGFGLEWEDLKLFEREVETLKALNHPAIPRYLDYFELDELNVKGFALVQSYIKARSLEDQLKGGRTFSEDDIKQLAQSLLEILTYLHDKHPPVLHRDIKPSNILLGDRSGNNVGQVYLVDFGSVQTLAAREGGTFTIVGTYGYTPFEQYGGRAAPASDLYALGATLIYLATGNHPADLPQKDGRIQFESVAHLSPALINWLKQMTQPSLDKRFADSTTALQALAALDSQREMLLMKLVASEDSSNFESWNSWDSDDLDVLTPDDVLTRDDVLDVIKPVVSAIAILVAVGGIGTLAIPWFHEMLLTVVQGLEPGQRQVIISVLLVFASLFRLVGLISFCAGIFQALMLWKEGDDWRPSIVKSLPIFFGSLLVEPTLRFLLKIYFFD